MAGQKQRFDKYIARYNEALEFLHRETADVRRENAELKECVSEQQKAEERAAAKARQRTDNPTFVDRVTRRFKS
ncbi:hypothetical protein [Rhodococcus sp. UNC23MFCrub1.1]|uniref:hypothetical protein n=1 Tax=Rhodococcus sp. UNC23MFCrub1.1 TaxID=1449068 RepID=UPI000480BCC0|nr:hypothetical protein [Rhodococcus sp. UNC23MFCrub1.1]